MGVMFQEQAAELQRQIVALQRERDTLERDRDRISGLWREQQQKAAASEKTVLSLTSRVEGLERQLTDHRAVAGRVAEAEKAAAEAATKAFKAAREERETRATLDKTQDRYAEARHSLAAAEQERDRLAAEIGPFRSLIGALKARAEADGQILTELGRLDG